MNEVHEDETAALEVQRVILETGSHKFYECPVSYFTNDKGLVHLISLVNWSEEMHTPLVDGGLLNHTNWYFEARNTIVGEQRKIENEELEKKRKTPSKGTHPPSKAANKGSSRRIAPSRR